VAVAWVLGAVAGFFVLISTAGQLVKYLTGHDELMGLLELTYVDDEVNFPTLFSVLLLAIASLCLAVVTALARAQKSRDAWRWAILGLGFLYLAFDEGISLHERLNAPVRALLGRGEDSPTPIGYWIVRGLVAAIVLIMLFWGFLRRLPPRTMRLFLLAGSSYLFGAAVLDTLGVRWGRAHGEHNAAYVTMATVEESLEMAGVIVFIYAVLDYLGRRYGEIRIRLGERAEKGAAGS
jgi:hypothetical protein